MRRMALVLAVTAGALGGTAAARAQEGPGGLDLGDIGRQLSERRMERLAERLGLSGEQKERFLSIHKEADGKEKAAREARDAAIRDLLTPEQREKWEARRKNPFSMVEDLTKDLTGQSLDLEKAMGDLGKLGGSARLSFGGSGASQLAERLGLDADQKEQVAKILEEEGRKSLEGLGGLDFSDPGKLAERATELSKKRDEVRKARAEKIRALLTESQKAKYDQVQKEEDSAPNVMAFGLGAGGDGEPQVLFGGGDGEGGIRILQGARVEVGEPGELRLRAGGGDEDGDEPAAGAARAGVSGTAAGAAARARSDLKLGPDEAEVLVPLIEKIAAERREQARARRQAGRELRALAGRDGATGEVRERLAAFRRTDAAHRDQIAKLSDELRSLVTPAQEAVLVASGVLD
ncbi:MAG: hypothetical protein L0216_07280 [Planctomycetales bacterium]|nr:hypothetical protein [Planctomycetales bacterium]